MDPLLRKGCVLCLLCLSLAQGLWAQCTNETLVIVKPDSFKEFGEDAGDTSLPSDASDGTSPAITLTTNLIFFQQQFDKVFVSIIVAFFQYNLPMSYHCAFESYSYPHK